MKAESYHLHTQREGQQGQPSGSHLSIVKAFSRRQHLHMRQNPISVIVDWSRTIFCDGVPSSEDSGSPNQHGSHLRPDPKEAFGCGSGGDGLISAAVPGGRRRTRLQHAAAGAGVFSAAD